MGVARFRVCGRLDMASRPSYGTLTIERASGVVAVRPLRRRRLYVTTLDAIAEWIVRSTIAAEVREKKAAKRARRRS